MNAWLWIVIAILAVVVFGLGMFVSWALRSRPDVARPQLLLGVFFTVVALVVVVDTVQLQVRFSKHVDENMVAQQDQLNCNQAQNNALIAIGNARRGVDEAALTYDQALQAFLQVPAAEREPDNPLVINLVTALNWLVAARKVATKAYAENPFPVCR